MPTTHDTPIIDCFGQPVPILTSDERTVVDSVLADVAATPNGVSSLDMRKSAHRRFVIDRFGGDEYLGRYFPSSHRLVEATRLAHEAAGGPRPWALLELDSPPIDTWHPHVAITYLDVEPDDVTVIAQGIVTLPGTASMMKASLILLDPITRAQFAVATLPNQYNVGTETIEITGKIPAGTPRVEAVLTALVLPAGAVEAQTVVARAYLGSAGGPAASAPPSTTVSEDAASPVASVSVINPNHNTHPTRDYIKVGLNRVSSQVSDCDYYYQFGESGSKPIVGLQVNGSAQLVNGYTVRQPPNFNGSCILTRRSSVGGGATLAFPSDKIPGLCTGSGGAVAWNIGPNWFAGAPWDQNNTIDLNFSLNFSVTPGSTASLRVTSVPQAVQTPGNLAKIAPIVFVWGCVAAGTRVRMADGSVRRIETLARGERVADGTGGSLRIAEAWTGHEAKPLVRIATASGAEVLLTDEHPVPTRDGVRLARDLIAGTIVTTTAGAEALCVVEAVSHDGPVVNLDLLPDGAVDLADVDDDAITAFEAGGIMVGDNRMQGVWSRRARTTADIDPIEALGPEWRLDVANSRRLAAGLPLVERI